MNPTLRVTEQGQTRWVAGEPTPTPTTALSRIDPDSVVRDALERQSSTVNAYLKAVGPAAQRTVDAAPRAAQGYSNAAELSARNARYFVTIASYVTVTAILAFGLVWLATLADITPGEWFWPAWFTLSGALALGLIWLTHRSESERTPEGIELERVRSDGYATERNADAQHVIATAVADAIRWRAESEHADAQARQLATESMFGTIASAPSPRRLTMTSTPMATDDAGMMQYATSVAAPTLPQEDGAPQWTVRPMQPDSGCLALCEAVAALYRDCAHRGDSLIVQRLPWSQRGDWSAAQKRKTAEVLAQLDPPLLLAGDGGRWRLNTADWHEQIALSAIRRRWR